MIDKIRPIIVMVDSQRESVLRLVRHCEALDGTKVGIVRLPSAVDAAIPVRHKHNDKACRAAFSLNWAARAMKGKPFLWMEHDAVPLKRGWVAALVQEYARLGKPFMLSSDSNPPNDIVGGIGIYSGDTSWMIPTNFQMSGWDLWMVKNLGPLISRTPLIQHSYGVYGKDGNCVEHRFPRDARMLRDNAVLFHRDVNHDLMGEGSCVVPRETEKVFQHAGDLGDACYHLAVMKFLGGGKLMLGSEMGFQYSRTREPMTPVRVAQFASLALVQPYVSEVEYTPNPPDPAWINLNLFRQIFRGGKGPSCCSLQRAGLRRFNLPVQDETQPWLTVDKTIPELSERIIVARSPRYHDPNFPWKQLVQKFGERMVFVGLPEEHKNFCSQQFGAVEYHPTETLLDVARVIASGKLFIGNQSCPYAIAEGLKKPAVQETWPDEPNCLFQRQDLLHLTSDFERISRFVEERITA